MTPEFEKWAKSCGYKLSKRGDEYLYSPAAPCWEAWQARDAEVEALKARIAELAAIKAKAAVPDGYVLVPVEPSEKMLDILYSIGPGSSDHLLVTIWAELLAAAAQAQQQSDAVIVPRELLKGVLSYCDNLLGEVNYAWLHEDSDYLQLLDMLGGDHE